MTLDVLDIGADPGYVQVGVGESALATEPEVLITRALGSCVGATLWDPRTHIGGMAHVMLPAHPAGAFSGRPHRFADIAIPELVEQLVDAGAGRHRLIVKVAGGSSMFKGESGLDSIGGRNVAAVLEQIAKCGLRVSSADTGGSHARTIELRLDSGVLLVRSYIYGMREI